MKNYSQRKINDNVEMVKISDNNLQTHIIISFRSKRSQPNQLLYITNKFNAYYSRNRLKGWPMRST